MVFSRMMKSRGFRKKSGNGSSHPLRLAVPISFLLCFTIAIYLLYCYSADAIRSSSWRTKTVAGDNLLATPWHAFGIDDQSGASRWAKLSRTGKILHCNYISCALEMPSFSYKSPSKNTTSAACPNFFQWIHEDLSPWRRSGISPKMVAEASKYAAFRVVIKDGKLYTELYYRCVQTRAMFTLWGLLLLLDRFPGQIPDVDLMFNCMDRPHFFRKDFKDKIPPPLFAYCGTRDTFDIAFPDWSYWGWAEVNIGPWDEESASIFQGSQATSWRARQPRAYWKGNPHVGAAVRTDLLQCNATDKHDFGADVYIQNWNAEAQQGFKNSKLANQCGHRYKLYAEGYAWSVSFKYIMACGSTLLLINPQYHDFFMRGLLPRQEYWPIDRHNVCPAIKQAVEWGNRHPQQAEGIGRKGQEFLGNDLSMEHVYDYMFHLLREYAKLQTFKPKVPKRAQRLCKNSILCIAEPGERDYLQRSLSHNQRLPPHTCRMPPANHGTIVKFKRQESANFEAVRAMVSRSSNTITVNSTTIMKQSKAVRSKGGEREIGGENHNKHTKN